MCDLVPLNAPIAREYRFQTVLFDVPHALAEQLYREAEPASSTVTLVIDEQNVLAKLEALARSTPEVVRVVRPELALAPDVRGRIPERVPGGECPRGCYWSDALHVEFTAHHRRDWAPFEVEFNVIANTPSGGVLARFSGDMPVPPRQRLMLVSLPSKAFVQQSTAPRAHAVIGFVQVEPVIAAPN
jgi:hypothetical protein